MEDNAALLLLPLLLGGGGSDLFAGEDVEKIQILFFQAETQQIFLKISYTYAENLIFTHTHTHTFKCMQNVIEEERRGWRERQKRGKVEREER